jgi:16S rRNA G966 N2-methylase RsmD
MTNLYNQIRRQEKKDLIRQVQQAAGGECQHETENSSAKLIQSDFQEIDSATIADSSIDLIFTDPPYKREWLQ